MADTITVKFKVLEDGTLKAVGKDAEKASAAMNKTAASTDNASRASDKYSKKNKGVANATSNSTKAFSKMTTGISSGLVPAYATLAANVFALTAAFGLLARNDAIGKLNEGLEYTGAVAGRNLTLVASKLKEITGNAISAEQSMRAVAVGTSAGFAQEQLESLTKIAKGASLALGRDMGDAMDRLIRGAAKLEPEILDELGIMVRLDDATKKYADTMNKTVDELTQFERRMAFTNAIIADGEKKFSGIQDAIDPSEYGQLSATFADLTKAVVQFINEGLGPLFGSLAANKFALGAILVSFGASISKDLVGSVQSHTEAAARNAKAVAFQAKSNLKNIKVTDSMTKHMRGLTNAHTMDEKQLRKLQRVSHSQVNLMNKSNPMYKTALKTRRGLTLATYKFTQATTKQGVSEAVGLLTTEGFTAARAKYLVTMEANSIATAKATVGQDFFTASIIRAKAAMLSASAAVKFYGTALLIAFPMIMGIITAIAILGPMIVGMFKKPEDGLSKQIKKTSERVKEFQKVVRAYTEEIKDAETATEAWFRTIQPLAGLFDQVSTSMRDINLEAQTKQIIAEAKARADLALAKKKENAIKDAKVYSSGLAGPVMNRTSGPSVAEEERDLNDALKLSEEDLQAIRESNMETLSALIARMKEMNTVLTDDTEKTHLQKDAVNVLAKSEAVAKKVLDDLINTKYTSIDQSIAHQEEIEAEALELKKGTEAYLAFQEIVSKARNLRATKTFGLFAKEIDNVTQAVAELDAIENSTKFGKSAGKRAAAAEQEAEKLVKAYGIVKEQVIEVIRTAGRMDESGNEVFSEEIKQRAETAAEAVKRFKEELIQLNKDAKVLQTTLKETAQLETGFGDDSNFMMELNLANAKENLRIKEETFEKTEKGGDAELAARIAVLEAEGQILELVKKRYDLMSSRAEKAGMGSGFAAIAGGQAAVSAAKNATYSDTVDKDGNITESAEDKKKDAVRAATVAQNKAGLAGVAKDLAKIGPEGELMSSVIEGALNMQTAFSEAFAIMGDDAASMNTKIQAGLGAAMALVNGLAQAYKADSKARLMDIDNQIAKEKERDGHTAKSIQTIKDLEAKKEAEKKKAFEREKKAKRAQTIMATAMAIMQAYALGGPIVGTIMAGFLVALGQKQLDLIDGQTYQGGGSSANSAGKMSVGKRENTVDLAKGHNAGGEIAYMRGAQGTGKGATDFKPAFSGYKNRAAGGFIVGEQGPELFMPDVPGEIYQSGKGPQSSPTVNFSISTVDATGVEDLLVNQKGHIIRMIRDAANEHGESFLESVTDSDYGAQM